MITRKLGPALAAGCTVVVKTAGEMPFTANSLLKLGVRAGIPAGVINSISAPENIPETGQALCSSKLSVRCPSLVLLESASFLCSNRANH